jgi:hypothetical protein
VGFAALTLACQAAEPFAGRWEGAVQIPGNELPLVIDLAPDNTGAWRGSMIAPGLNANGIPLKDVVIRDSDASFAIKTAPQNGIEATFKAHLTANHTLIGEFSQAGNKAPFELTQVGPAQVEVPPQSTAISKNMEGEWLGEFQLFGYPRKVTLKLTNKEHGAAAEFVVVGKRVNNLPVDLISETGNFISIQSHETGVTFEGRLRKDTGEMRGTFSQGPIEVPLILRRK